LISQPDDSRVALNVVCSWAVVCRHDNKTSVVKVNFGDEKLLMADVVLDHDWTAVDRPTSVCLKSVLPLLSVAICLLLSAW